jgi:hypothetical protein
MRHTPEQLADALRLVPMPDAKAQKAWEAQLRADNPGAWFIVAGRTLRAQREAEAWDSGDHRCYGPCDHPIHREG